ncbi:type IV secretion system DNA-binding domain-containing protein [Sphingomonas corticis]|uniref:Type IV secretion system DNA-binding domain-containing protein n=1 Tax=Sphingomonas corticis TaxID=2722791 RepID=A0ABX1CRE4_9SPHN|nr:type IV secretion system DNA-binding domain-containing protein [Sphingomonas corticis]NJR80518.1 type IV secretion system DNA-binding domain-containing protein [Sphingomonas corticis]
MGISYPFRFRREPEPVRASLTLATPDTLNPAMLDAVRAGSGDRIAVIGDGAAFTALADQTRDLLIDPAHGNWDFFADHPSDHARSSAVEAFLPAEPRICAGYTGAYRYVLLRAMEHGGREPGAGLAAVRDLVRALPPEAVAEAAGHDPANGHALRWGMTVLAGVTAPLLVIADHDPRFPRVSIARWLAGPASTILFVRHDPDRSTRETDAVIASLRDHAMLGRIEVATTMGLSPALSEAERAW